MWFLSSHHLSPYVMPPKKTAAELKREAEAQRLKAKELEEEIARAEEEEAAEAKRREDARRAAEARKADAARRLAEAARIRAENEASEKESRAKLEGKGKGGVVIKWGPGKCVNCTKAGADCVPQVG